VVSFGPDGEPSTFNLGNPDDIIYYFGKVNFVPTETSFNPIVIVPAP
jgi:hypothetical protein